MSWEERRHPRGHGGKFAHEAGGGGGLAALGEKKLTTVRALIAKGNDRAATPHEKVAYLERASAILAQHGLHIDDLPEVPKPQRGGRKPTAEEYHAHHFGPPKGQRDPTENVTSRNKRDEPPTTRSGAIDKLLAQVSKPGADLSKVPASQLDKVAAELKRRIDAGHYSPADKVHAESRLRVILREKNYR